MSNKSDNGESLELKTLKALDLSSWLKSDSAWKDLEFDVGELNGPVRKSLKAKLEDLISKKYAQISGQPVLGQGGTGKTHLLSYLRKIVFEKKGFFILADMTTVGDFWSVLALEAAKSLEKPGFDGLPQCLGLAARLAAAAGLPLASPEEHFQKAETAEIAKLANDIFLSLFRNRQVRQEAQNFSDLIRVIFFLNSEDQEAYNWGLQWLKGTNLEMEQKFRDFGFNAFNRSAAEEAIRGLTWLSSIGGGFSVIAVDQLDSLIKYNALPTSNELEVAESARIMTGVSSGLAALISQAHDCLTVVTLLPDSWDNLVSKGLRPAMERMDRPFKLSLIPSFEVGRRLLSGRLQKAAELTGFSIPSKDWPFPEGFFDGVEYWSPRHLLNAAKKHIDNIIDNPPLPDVFKTLEEKFVEHYLAAEIGLLKHKDSEKEFWPQALAALAEAFRLGAEELAISKDLEIDWNSDKLKKNYSNYVFIKCVSPSNPAADRFFSLWAVMTTHHSRYASELETALLQSGLNGKLPQRRLALIRYDSPPNSDKCKALLKKIISENGWKFDLKETELRFIYALHKISEEFKDIFPNWAASKKPAQCLPNLSPHFSWLINSDQNWLLPASFLPDEHRDALFKSGILRAVKLKEPLHNDVLDSVDAGVSSPPARKMREARQPAENPSSSSSTKDDAKSGLNLGEDAKGHGAVGQGAEGHEVVGQDADGQDVGRQSADDQDVGRQSADDQDVGGQDAEGYDVGGEGADGHEVDGQVVVGQVVENCPKSSEEEEEEIAADGRNQNEVAEKRPAAKTTDPVFLIGSFVDRPVPQLASLSSLSLTKHAAILGGTGSGKTVLLRRLIEEASLAGIPVLVIDVAGDLTYLGQSWPNPNLKLGDWLEGDLDRAKKYIANANTVVWTPGNSQGNPLYFSSVPDFRGLRDEPMRLQDAQDMALESVLSILKIKLDSSLRKRGIIAAAIGHMAESPELAGAGLNGLRNVLRNMPQDVIDSLGDKTEKMASEMANDLAAAEIVSPELKELSVSDISLLFRGPKGEPRISVVNLNWLNQLDKKLLFVQKILMNVFSWVSRHSGPSLSGLIVVDEAKVFAPNSQEKAPASKLVIRKMAEQLRKYGYGLVLASQALKSIDSATLANCHTVVIGRMNAIVDIDECKRHYNIADAKSLGAGEFYIRSTGESESSESPFRRLKTALCLSHHPSPSPSESDILRLARDSREY